MRVLFAGTAELAIPSLRLLSERGLVAAVLTNPDRPAGRERRLEQSPVKAEALRLGLEVLQPEKLDAAFRERVKDLAAELLAVVAFGRIFGPRFLGLFPRGGLNLHPSLLPRWRGPSPISAAILNGDRQSGISVQRLALEMDAGDLVVQERFELDGTETTGSLSAVCAERGAVLLATAVGLIEQGRADLRAQDPAGISFCRLVSKQDGRVDWNAPADRIERMVRAYSPWPSAHTTLDGLMLMLHGAAVVDRSVSGARPGLVLGVDTQAGILVQTGNRVLALSELQLEARRRMDFRTFLNGRQDLPGRLLGG